jgi:hypothetical protein
MLKNHQKLDIGEADLEKLIAHSKNVEMKKSEYNQQKYNLRDGECLCVFDFKENLSLTMVADEFGHDFYNRFPISVLTFVCFIKKNGYLYKKFFTFLSVCTNHTASFASDCLDRVLKYPLFNDIGKVYLWSDNGPHFHNNQFINFIFLNGNFKNKVIVYNFFCENHGKDVCDQFFGDMTMRLRQYRMEKRIEDINGLFTALSTLFSTRDSEYFFEMFFFMFY